MKHTKLVPNAIFSKEWEGYMRSWPVHKKLKGKRKRLVHLKTSEPPFLLKSSEAFRFSVQEIKTAAQRHTACVVTCLKDNKLNQ